MVWDAGSLGVTEQPGRLFSDSWASAPAVPGQTAVAPAPLSPVPPSRPQAVARQSPPSGEIAILWGLIPDPPGAIALGDGRSLLPASGHHVR